MRFLNLLKKENGSALVLVMLTFAVVAILGTAVVTSSMGEIKQSVALDKDMRAYYQARSAADATMSWIEKKVIYLNALSADLEATHVPTLAAEKATSYALELEGFEKVVSPTATTEGTSVRGTLNNADNVIDGVTGVAVWHDSTYIYTKATATVQGKSASAMVRLNQSGTSKVSYTTSETTLVTNNTVGLFNDSIYAAGNVDFNSNAYHVIGSIHYEGTFTGGKSNITGACEKVVPKDMKDWNPPAGLTLITTLPSNRIFNSSGRYNGSNTMNNDYTIDTGVKQDIILYITDLTISNNVTITATGTGRVFLFVDKLTTGNKFDIISNQTSPFVYLILDKGTASNLEVGGNGHWEAFIYAPGSNISAAHGTPDIYGAVICKNFEGIGSPTVTYRTPNLKEEDFNGGSSTGTTTSQAVGYTRLEPIGLNGKQWIKG